LTFQRRQVILDHIPDRIPVDSRIVVDKDIPHPDDVRGCGPEFRRETPHRFPDDLEMVDHLDLRHLVVGEVITTPG